MITLQLAPAKTYWTECYSESTWRVVMYIDADHPEEGTTEVAQFHTWFGGFTPEECQQFAEAVARIKNGGRE